MKAEIPEFKSGYALYGFTSYRKPIAPPHFPNIDENISYFEEGKSDFLFVHY